MLQVLIPTILSFTSSMPLPSLALSTSLIIDVISLSSSYLEEAPTWKKPCGECYQSLPTRLTLCPLFQG
jgi:hypothetical protein